MADSTDHSLSRATLWAALIGGTCVIIAALIAGMSVGNRRAGEKVDNLQQDVHSRDQSLDSMEVELGKPDAQINALKDGMEEQQRLAAELKRELAALSGTASPPVQTSKGEGSGFDRSPEEAPPEKSVLPTLQRIAQGDFNFELRGCARSGDLVRCSLAVTNMSDSRERMNLCGASHLADDAGRTPGTRVQFDGGSCGVFGLEPKLPRAFQMSASIPGDAKNLNVVLRDGNWFSFSGSAIFRDVRVPWVGGFHLGAVEWPVEGGCADDGVAGEGVR
jgi:hypothetical protein